MAHTNADRLLYLESRMQEISKEIQNNNQDDKLRNFALKVKSGKVSVECFIDDTFDYDPQRKDKIFEYYLCLFSEFTDLKREEMRFRDQSHDNHHRWLNEPYQKARDRTGKVAKFAEGVVEKVIVSGATAGLIWIGSTIAEHWPFFYPENDENS